MRRKRVRQEEDADIDITPMLDIVFIMLIFFIVTATFVKESGIDVQIVGTDFNTFIKRSELARDRNDQRSDRFAVGEKVDARVIQFDKKARKVQVSIKALEVAEEKEAIAQYGSSDSGATLGDILGTALKNRDAK